MTAQSWRKDEAEGDSVCLASTITCIAHSARDVPSFGSPSFCSSPLSILFRHGQIRFFSCWAQMSGFPSPLFLTCTTRPSRASCLPLPAHLPFLVLIGFPILIPLVLFDHRRRQRWCATKQSRTLWLLSKSSALSSCSPPPVGLKGKPICSRATTILTHSPTSHWKRLLF